MPDERLRSAFESLRVRVPASEADAAALRDEVRAVGEALGALLREGVQS